MFINDNTGTPLTPPSPTTTPPPNPKIFEPPVNLRLLRPPHLGLGRVSRRIAVSGVRPRRRLATMLQLCGPLPSVETRTPEGGGGGGGVAER